MIAKIVTKHYTNGTNRYIDVGDDFKVYSATYGQIFGRYYPYLCRVPNEPSSDSITQRSKLFAAISALFDLETYNTLIHYTRDNEFSKKLEDIQKENEFFDLVRQYGTKDLYENHILSFWNDIPCDHLEQNGDRFTVIQYTDKNGKNTMEKFYAKDVYIINNNGKTVEAYRTNFCG